MNCKRKHFTILYSIYHWIRWIKKGYSVDNIIKRAEDIANLDSSCRKAIVENLSAIKTVIKDRPELGKAWISDMSWEDIDGDGNPDHNPKGMQACTFERDDQVDIF